ncbi:hypothetical protein Tco_0914207 [Tanacetum coccineum]
MGAITPMMISHGVMVFGENGEHVLDGVWHCCLRLIVSFIRYRVMVSDINFAWYPRYLLFAFCIADVFQRRGRNGPQGLEEPMSDEVLIEKNVRTKLSPNSCAQRLKRCKKKKRRKKAQCSDGKSATTVIYGEDQKEGTETGIPEARHHTPAFSKGLRSTDPLHRDPGHGKNEACLIGWEERSQLHAHVLIVVNGVPKQKELK